jgi:3-oxoacyl-[acyl-carrier protein] reductase
MQMETNRKVALVTNAADYAGPPAVTALSEAGFQVLVHDDTFEDWDAWHAYSDSHPNAVRISAATPKALIEDAWNVSGHVNVIVSNDHFPAVHRELTHALLDDLRQTLEKLVVTPFALLKESIPFFERQGGGNVVMITSCRTKLPMYGGAIPDAGRAAANALVRSFAIELAGLNVAVNAIAPNFLYSEAYYPRDVFVDDSTGSAYVRSEVPVGRLGRPEEIGELIRFLASTESRFLTGSVIDFSGAWPAGKPRPWR